MQRTETAVVCNHVMLCGIDITISQWTWKLTIPSYVTWGSCLFCCEVCFDFTVYPHVTLFGFHCLPSRSTDRHIRGCMIPSSKGSGKWKMFVCLFFWSTSKIYYIGLKNICNLCPGVLAQPCWSSFISLALIIHWFVDLWLVQRTNPFNFIFSTDLLHYKKYTNCFWSGDALAMGMSETLKL